MSVLKNRDFMMVFWPDLAPIHYTLANQEFLQSQGISFIPKAKNPPNCPMIRPIEQYWANLKAKVYAND